MSARCESPGCSNFPLRGRICVPCLERPERLSLGVPSETSNTHKIETSYNQDHDQVSPPPPTGLPGPGCNPDDLSEGPELYRLIAAYESGELDADIVTFGKMPPWAGSVMKAIAEDMRLL